MRNHEQYEELCALATIGEASASELDDLKVHLKVCPDCRRDYEEFAEHVLPQLVIADSDWPEFSETATIPDAASMRARFTAKAQAAGISFSAEAAEAKPLPTMAPPTMSVNHRRRKSDRPNWAMRGAIAASLMVATGVGSYYGAVVSNRANEAAASKQEAGASRIVPSGDSSKPSASLVASNAIGDAKKMDSLELRLRDAVAQLAEARATSLSQKAELQQMQQRLSQVQTEGQLSQQAANDLRTKLQAAQALADSNQAYFVADEARIKDLTEQVQAQKDGFDQQLAMLSKGGEVSTMMTARNLHIIDVTDTDENSKTKSAFGRIFFAENKRLVFYAFDLNQARIENGKYAYRIWGDTQSASGEHAKALGIFSPDDKGQKRWIFKYDDPKVLSQIEALYVTLEPVAKESDRPRGQKLMYAYLRGQLNHP